MGFSPLANMSRRIPDGGRYNERQSPISGFTIHHNAGVNAYGEATNPGREVSAQYWITNEGDILPNVDETLRAFTTGAPGYPAGTESDHRNITVEVSNSPEGVTTGTWAISSAAQTALQNLIGDVFRRHGLGEVHRASYGGVAVHQDFVPTSCPGPYIMNNLSAIIAGAEAYRSGAAPAPKPEVEWEDTLKAFNGKSTRKTPQQVRGGNGMQYLKHKDDGTPVEGMGGRTIAQGPGYVVGLEVNLVASGNPGVRVAAQLVKETGDDKGRTRLANPRDATDSIGKAGFQIGWSGYLKEGELLRVLVQPQAGETLTVDNFYWSGLARPGAA